jgi:hypothetical protein
MWCSTLVLIHNFTAEKNNSYTFFTIGVMDFLCDFGVNSPFDVIK